MPSIQVTGQLVDPTTGVESSADIRIASLINYGQTTKKSISHKSTDASGNYDFQLVYGKHLIFVKYEDERIYIPIGYAVVGDSTPDPVDLIQLINLSDENPPSELVTELQQLREDTLNDIVDTSAQVLENAGYQGEWISGTSTALKGETWQVSGRYYVALKDTSVDPINDNENWREVVNTESLTTAQNDIVGGSIFKGSNGEAVENGNVVEPGNTHLRVLFNGKPAIVAISPIASGIVSSLTESSAIIGSTNVDLVQTTTKIAAKVSDISSISGNPGEKLKCLGFHQKGDFVRHPGFIVKSGSVTEVTGRKYNLSNGNHAEIDCDENSINANWLGVNSGRTGEQNSQSISDYLSQIPSGNWHTIFFHQNIPVDSCEIGRDNTALVTHLKVELSTSDWAFRPNCNNFKMVGFRSPDNFNGRFSYLAENTSQVENHDYEDIKINGANPVTKTPFLYSVAPSGAGWKNISYTKVRGLAEKTATAPFINHDHGSTVNLCLDTFLYKCRAHGYEELYESSGSGFAKGLSIKNSFAIDCNGKGVITYHTRGGLVIDALTVQGHGKTAYIWAGVEVTSTSREGAQITNSKFIGCTDPTPNPNDGVSPFGHGVLYEQLQKAHLSGNIYQANNGAGYVYGAGCYIDNANGETSTQNVWGAIVAGDAGGFTDRIRHVSVSNANHWGNLRDSILVCGRVEALNIKGGNHKQNCTSNSALDKGYASIRFDKNHSEAKINGGVPEANPQLNYLSIDGSALGIFKIGTPDVQGYPQYSVSVDQDVSTNIVVTGGTSLNARYDATKDVAEFNIVTPTGTRLFVLGCIKESTSSLPLLSAGSSGVSNKVVNGTYDWDGNVVV